MRRAVTTAAAATLAALATVAVATPAQAADRTIRLTSPAGAVHSVLTWDDSVDTLCLTLRSTASGASAIADMRLTTGAYPQHLSVSPSRPRHCTGNLSIPEDRLAEMRIAGGTDRWWDTTGWARFYT